MKASKKTESKKEMEERFQVGEDFPGEFDVNLGTKVVNIELPVWAIKELDKESTRRGVARQALMKMWLIDRLDALRDKNEGAA